MNQMTDKKKRHQVKSSWYYLFWGTATVAVVAGQVYVGTGYRLMARGLQRLLSGIELKVEKDLMYHEFKHELDKRELQHYLEKQHPMVIR